jgi:hypothetical protein
MKPVAVLLFFGLTALAQDKPGVLEGSVVNSVTGAGLEGVHVTLLGSHKDGLKQSDTDSAGNFHISGIAPGDYRVFVQRTGFSSPPLVSSKLSVPSVHVDAGTDPPHLRLALVPPATLRGRVFGTDGKPAANVQVTLDPQFEKKTTTDDYGAFVFENIPPGEHSLTVLHEHVRTYFPATTDPASAEPISVRPGEDQGGYEIRLQTASVYRLHGVVLDAAGQPSANSVVQLLPDLPGADERHLMLSFAGSIEIFSLNHSTGVQAVREPSVRSGKDGAFEFPFVREGNWVLRAEAENVDRGAALVSVRKDIDDVRIRLEGPVEILGRTILIDGSPAPANAFINLLLTSTEGTRNAGGSVDKTGSLRIEDVSPGNYRVTALAISAGYYVASIMVGEVDAMRQPALLSDSSPPLRIILKAGGRLSGNVDKGEGSKLLLVPQTLAPGDFARVYPCGAGGNFELAGIPPGDYYAIAVTQFKAGIEGLRAIGRDATPVHLEEGVLTQIQLKAPVELP